MVKKRRIRVKIGDVFAIPLPNGKFAFGRRFKDAHIAIYQHIGTSIEDTPKDEKYQFNVGVYDYVLKLGEWPIIENQPFENEEEAWPPPECIIDSLNGQYRLYHKGEMKPGSKEECEGLEIAAVWDKHHIVDRIMGDDKWDG